MEKDFLRKYHLNYPVELRFVNLTNSQWFYVEFRIVKDPQNNMMEERRRQNMCWLKRMWLKDYPTHTRWHRVIQYDSTYDTVHPDDRYKEMVMSYKNLNLVREKFKTVGDILAYLDRHEEDKKQDIEKYQEKYNIYPSVIY